LLAYPFRFELKYYHPFGPVAQETLRLHLSSLTIGDFIPFPLGLLAWSSILLGGFAFPDFLRSRHQSPMARFDRREYEHERHDPSPPLLMNLTAALSPRLTRVMLQLGHVSNFMGILQDFFFFFFSEGELLTPHFRFNALATWLSLVSLASRRLAFEN